MKQLIALALTISFSAFASNDLEAQRARVQEIINKNQKDINIAIKVLRQDQAKLRTSVNSNTTLQDIQNACADGDFEKFINNVKNNWEYDYVKMTTRRLESSYRGYLNNPDITPVLTISQSEVFKAAEKIALARSLKVCKYNELFTFVEDADFKYAKDTAWQNYNAVLSFQDITSGKYDKTLRHIVYRGPIKVEGNLTRFGSPEAAYRFGKVQLTINYDKVPSAGYRFKHPDETNPIEIIKKAKRL